MFLVRFTCFGAAPARYRDDPEWQDPTGDGRALDGRDQNGIAVETWESDDK